MSDIKEHFPKLNESFVTDFDSYLKLIPTCKQLSSSDIKVIYKALYKASLLHKNMKRKSGEDYITHPIAVSSLLANYGLDAFTLTAALLHDTVEDTIYTLEECEKEFGYKIASLVDDVTKVGKDVNLKTHEKIIESVNNDVRAIAIKSADRLHNMYTLDFMSPSKQIEIATETKDFYVPIAKILGIYKVKDELQDLCLYYLNYDEFLNFEEKRNKYKEKYKNACELFGTKVQKELSMLGIGMYYNYRIKNVGALYEESLKRKNIDDLVAIKIVLKNKLDCYQTLGICHRIGKQKEGMMHDYISSPKDNGYRSLNTNISFKNKDIQVRIRTEEMQKINDLGVFADLDYDKKEICFNNCSFDAFFNFNGVSYNRKDGCFG